MGKLLFFLNKTFNAFIFNNRLCATITTKHKTISAAVFIEIFA